MCVYGERGRGGEGMFLSNFRKVYLISLIYTNECNSENNVKLVDFPLKKERKKKKKNTTFTTKKHCLSKVELLKLHDNYTD